MLYLHRSARADLLADALGDVLSVPLGDPMAAEVVAVPTRGVERWLSQRLAQRLGAGPGGQDGVCANIEWPFPAALVTAVVAAARPAALAPPGGPRSPWSPECSVWVLLQLVDSLMGEDFMRPLAEHLRSSSVAPADRGPRRFSAARHIADLFDRYAVHRPEMLKAWAQGGPGPAAPTATWPQDVAWQAELWRRLRQRLGVPSPAETLDLVAASLEEGAGLLDLPARVSCFGLTRLPASHLRVLKAVSVHRDVHLFLLHPSGALWDKVAAASPHPPRGLTRSGDVTAALAGNPLLRSWGRDSREMQLVLAAEGLGGGEHRPVPAGPPTLLGRLQDDIRADRAPPGAPRASGTGGTGNGPGVPADARPLLSPDDDSVRIHACHGRARQVEVAREAVLHLLAADPTLEPRDVIIMCPDIEIFAPLVKASFETAGLSGGPQLRARLADRSLRQTNPLLAVAAHLLEMAGGRVTAADVLDFSSRQPVSRRFGFDEEALSRIERWLAGTGTRWGLDGGHRAAWRLDGVEVATWRAGLDRLLLGVAMADEGRLFGDILPFGDLSAGDIDLAGRLAELVQRLRLGLGRLAGPHSAAGWAEALAWATAQLACSAPDEAWQDDQLHQLLEDIVDEATAAPPAQPVAAPPAQPVAAPPAAAPAAELDLAEVQSLLADRLRGRPTRANFRTGDMTICTLVPMRSVPHRVVCLLGLDDGLFPRPSESDGDDLLLADPRVGDRDIPSEDRQLLLDALLAATQHLVITYEGRDLHLNQRRPPAVPVSELLEVIDRTVRLADPGQPASRAVLVQHPLQAFDPRNFTPGRLGLPGPWRFDEPQRDAAEALAGPRAPRRPFCVQRLAPLGTKVIELGAVVRFLEHPVRAFLRERLGFYAADSSAPISGAMPLELGPLERWALGDRLLAAALSCPGPDREAGLDAAVAAELGRGLLPPGQLGDLALAEVRSIVSALVAEVANLPCAKLPAAPVDVSVVLPDGRLLTGTVPGVHDGTLLRCTYSKLAPKHRLRAWVQFLAFSAAHPELAPSAVTIGQAEGSNAAQPRLRTQTILPLAEQRDAIGSAALRYLAGIVDLFDRGMREPLPLYCATSAAWADAVSRGEDGAGKARGKWAAAFDDGQGEADEPEHVAVLGEAVPFEQLLDAPPGEDECGPGWPLAPRHRFGRLAVKLWEPVLHHETLKER